MYFAAAMDSVDIILPAYNPLTGWELNVIQRFQSLQKKLPGVQFHLIIVNDGSARMDETASAALIRQQIPDFQWITYRVNQGKGYALREGVRKSTSDYIVYTDIDWPYEEESMIGLINVLRKNADAVIGVRNEEYYKHLPPARQRISKLLKKINARYLHLKVDDTQAGLKGFRKKIKDEFLKTTINRYLFDLEFIFRMSRRKDIVVIGFPISLRPGITFSKMNRKILFQEAGNFVKIWLRP